MFDFGVFGNYKGAMKKPVADQIRFRHVEAKTNWGAPDDRFCLHIKPYDYSRTDWTCFSVAEYEAFGDAATAWCRKLWKKPFQRDMNPTGTWYANTDRKMFVFRRKEQAMLFKLTWSA
ncbi:hypothetical protein D3C87_1069660 [compost metagenome]